MLHTSGENNVLGTRFSIMNLDDSVRRLFKSASILYTHHYNAGVSCVLDNNNYSCNLRNTWKSHHHNVI